MKYPKGTSFKYKGITFNYVHNETDDTNPLLLTEYWSCPIRIISCYDCPIFGRGSGDDCIDEIDKLYQKKLKLDAIEEL